MKDLGFFSFVFLLWSVSMLRVGNFSLLRNTCNTFTRAGQAWRVVNGLPRSGNEVGELHDGSDWSYAGRLRSL